MTCCGPSRGPADGGQGGDPPPRPLPAMASARPAVRFVDLPGGEVVLGDDGPWAYRADGEHRRHARIAPYAIATTAVTNAEFAAFVAATGWRTVAERAGWSFVFGGLLPDDFPDTRGVAAAPWWREVHGADWAHPEGPHSGWSDRADHPVVHVARTDAETYAAWAGARLPSEAEWETAARAGTTTTWPWGEELEPDGDHRMNVFQGDFPTHDTGADGWIGTCPVDAFEPNAWGLSNMLGNVWEWTGETNSADTHAGAGLLKGGSYLCHDSWCRRYRPAARMTLSADSTVGNVGFRVAR